MAGFMTLFQRATLDGQRGRVYAAIGSVQGLALLIGTLVAGAAAQGAGIVPIIALQGLGYVVAGAATGAALRRCEHAAAALPRTASAGA